MTIRLARGFSAINPEADGVVAGAAALDLTVAETAAAAGLTGLEFLSGIPGSGLAIDGVFGPMTDAAVRGFQHALSIAVDGIVGAVTWRALVSGMLAG